jgi:hypothetical protein
LNDTYKGCGKEYYNNYVNKKSKKELFFGPSLIKKACYSYIGKQSQLFELHKYLSDDRLLVINYESITTNPQNSIPILFDFLDLEYKDEYIEKINRVTTNTISNKNSSIIDNLCIDVYEKAKKLAII